MTPVLVDSNVLIDVLGPESIWRPWSVSALRQASERSELVINPLVYAELSVGFDTIEALDDSLPLDLVHREDLPYGAAFLAGKVFARYRQAGGIRRSPLPDFYIGAHAALAGYELLTRDASRYRTYFPRLTLIAPPA